MLGGRLTPMSKASEQKLDMIRRWRLRADECRLLASEATTTIARRKLLDVVEHYEAMASDAEARRKKAATDR